MKPILSGKQMKIVDEYTINKLGIPSLVLMERAALSVLDLIVYNEDDNSSVFVVCGTGNNGADGVALARMLYIKGFDVSIGIVGDTSKGSQEFKTQLDIANNINVPIVESFVKADIIVDAVFGVGLSRNVEGEYKAVIETINNSNATIYSVDVPSGINAENGAVMGVSVKADYTVTFGSEKLGTVLYPGASYCGEVIVADLGYPEVSYNQCDDLVQAFERTELSLIPFRPNYSNKGTFGKVLVIAGNEDMSGAAAMCAMAAYRTGVGMVRVLTVEQNREIIAKLVPEAIITCFNNDRFDKKIIESAVKWADVIAVGPGMGKGSNQRIIINECLESQKQVVIDADGINNIANDNRLLEKLHRNVILTPHIGEMSRLTIKPIDEIKSNMFSVAKDFAYKNDATVVLKDARTVIYTNDKAYINLTGNNGMATAGSGDVLCGIIVGLLGIGVAFNDAAILGPYIHGLAGDLAASKISKTSLMATDIIEELKNVFSAEWR